MPVRDVASDQEFQTYIGPFREHDLTIVDFYAVWCGPCKVIKPAFSKLSETYTNVSFMSVDVDKLKQTAARYQVTAMPTFILFKKGEKVDEMKGADPKGLERMIKLHLAADEPVSDENVAKFTGVTGAPANVAKQFLGATKNDVDAALALFFENGAQDEDDEEMDDDDGDEPSSSIKPSAGGPSTKGKGPIRTLNDLGGDESDDEEHENFFSGGEKSGVAVQGGPKEKKGATDLVKDIVSKANKRQPDSTDEKKEKPKFTGQGFKLGSEDKPAEVIPGAQVEKEQELVERRLTFWKNGFSIEDGPLLSYTDPQNEQLLRAINSGRAPTSILNVEFGQPVEVKVDHRMQEDYVPPAKKPFSTFSGSGNRLGGVTSSGAGSSSATMPGAFPSSSAAQPAAPAFPAIAVDPSAPSTSIQVRLASGARLVVKLNQHHTVQDLYNSIVSQRPEEAQRSFVLQTTFPSKDLLDKGVSLKDAGLLNAVVIQRLT
ncbi:hypothetical protein HDU97_005900 [Phlyctochytrium planicorne]|nr:hypothetical protein HDU97_005900 [Phlyctochytrium planicorne]